MAQNEDKELHDRLVAWWVSGEQLPEVWNEALIRFTVALDEADEPFEDTPATLLRTCFEEALTAYDDLLRNTRELGGE